MKRFFNIILALAVLIPGLWGCQPKTPETPQKVVDLRYRVDDSYELDAISPQSISIIISSTDPWTVTTAHPEWCTIDIEEGAGSNPDSVHVGLGTKRERVPIPIRSTWDWAQRQQCTYSTTTTTILTTATT